MDRKRMWISSALLAFLIFYSHPVPAFSREVEEEGHKPCGLCHEMAGEKAGKVKIEPDTETTNPYTGNPYGPVDGVCVRCHANFTHQGGHPLGIRPEKVKVPDECMGYKGQEKDLTCLACHNPHLHQTRYKFLRWQVADKKGVQHLCNRCHVKNAPVEHFGGR